MEPYTLMWVELAGISLALVQKEQVLHQISNHFFHGILRAVLWLVCDLLISEVDVWTFICHTRHWRSLLSGSEIIRPVNFSSVNYMHAQLWLPVVCSSLLIYSWIFIPHKVSTLLSKALIPDKLAVRLPAVSVTGAGRIPTTNRRGFKLCLPFQI